MNAIHIMMSTSTSANPHTAPTTRIETLARKRKISAITFLIFGVLLITAGSLLASFERQRFSVSFIVFGAIGIIFAFMYWISAEKILITLRKLNAERTRQARFYAQNSGTINFGSMNSGCYRNTMPMNLPSYEQSIFNRTDIPPPYEEAIKSRTHDAMINDASQAPIQSISLSVAQATSHDVVSPHTSCAPSTTRKSNGVSL